jgi:transcriptional antiterminator RfaH
MPLDLTDNPVVSHRPHPHRIGPIPVRCCCNSPRWTVVATWPLAERWAHANLSGQGITCYLPLLATRRTDRRGDLVDALIPLFAGYLFVQHEPAESWTPIRTTPGVRAMLRNGTQLQYAQEADIRLLQAGEVMRATTTQPDAAMAPGAAVEVLRGPFARHCGQLVAAHRDRAVVTLMLFGRLQDVHVAVADLAPAGE